MRHARYRVIASRRGVLFAASIACLFASACGGDDDGATSTRDAGSSRDLGVTPRDGATPLPTDGGPPPGSLAECGVFTAGDDLRVCTSTYLGGAGADRATAVDVLPDGVIVVGGDLPGVDFGASTTVVGGGGDGAVVRFAPGGGDVLTLTRVGGSVRDLAASTTDGRIAVAIGGVHAGVSVLSADGATERWHVDGDATRVAIGRDGAVAALFGTSLRLFDADGAPRGTVALDDGTVSDVAYDELNDLAFVTGFNQVSGDLQQPFLRAYGADGTIAWVAYDWTSSEALANGSSSDTRGYGVAMGRDGKLYYVGEGHGGVSTHRFMPRDLSVAAPLVKYDAYNDPHNLNGAAPIGFVGRFEPATGALLAAQFAVVRLSNGNGNAVRHRAVAADADGTVILGGASACCIEGAADKTINGVPAMPAYAGGGYVLVLSPDLSERLVWTAWTGDSGGAEVSGVAAWNGVMAMVETQSADRDTGALLGTLVTARALQSAPGGGASEGFLAVWPGP